MPNTFEGDFATPTGRFVLVAARFNHFIVEHLVNGALDGLKRHGVADDAIEFWDLTNREDWGISDLSQKGISSRAYKPGPYSTREALLHAFDEMVLEREAQSKRK